MSLSSSTSSSSSTPPRKRKQAIPEPSDSSVAEDISVSDASNTSEEDSDAPQPPPPIEEPVLSHAERRRRKKKQKRSELEAATESQSPRKKRKLDDGSGVSSSDAHVKAETKTKHTNPTKDAPAADDPRRQKRQNSVWVGNLSYRTTEETLRGFFDGVGTITRVHMPMRRPQNENMGFAYVDFETPDAKVIAVALSEGQLDGRNLLIKDGDNFAGRPAKAKTEDTDGDGEGQVKNATTTNRKVLSKTAQKILRIQKQPPAQTLFLGNLGFGTTEASIRELFEAHRYWKSKGNGEGADIQAGKQKADEDAAKSKDLWIRKIRMGTFEDSGNCKGWAFVDFTSTEHATDVLVNPRNHRLNGRDLVVEYASPEAVRRGGGPRNRKGDGDRKNKSEFGVGRTSQKGSAHAPFIKQRRPHHVEQEDHADDEIVAKATMTPRSEPRRSDRAGHDRPHARRSRPGAALAQAQRQSAAILPGQGQKIVF